MLKGLWQGVLSRQECKEKASESEGSEAFIPATLPVALPCGDDEQYQALLGNTST